MCIGLERQLTCHPSDKVTEPLTEETALTLAELFTDKEGEKDITALHNGRY